MFLPAIQYCSSTKIKLFACMLDPKMFQMTVLTKFCLKPQRKLYLKENSKNIVDVHRKFFHPKAPVRIILPYVKKFSVYKISDNILWWNYF